MYTQAVEFNFRGIPVDTKLIQNAGLHSIPTMTKSPSGWLLYWFLLWKTITDKHVQQL